DVPHDDLVALPDALAGKLSLARCGAAHVDDGSLVADRLGDEARHQRRIGPELCKLARVFGERQEAARHRIARGVVAPDDEQRQVAYEYHLRHRTRALAVRHHGYKVEPRWRLCPLVPEALENLGHAQELGEPFLLRMNRRVGSIDVADGNIRPVGQLATLLPG